MGYHEIGQKTNVENALKILYSKAARVGAEEANVTNSLGRVVNSEIRSTIDVPHFNRSAMDGFAVVADDTFGCTQQNPATLEVVGECKIGEIPAIRIARGKAVEVATGSQIPDGANAVAKVENTERNGNSLRVFFPVTPGEHVSKVGEDIKKGDVVIDFGQTVRPQDVSVLLACGILKIKVARRPTVGIIATGNELIEPQNVPVPGKVFNVNSHSLSAYVTQYGGTPVNLGIVEDSYEELKRSLESASKYDLIVFSGSTSIGKKDMLPEVVSSVGEVLFRGVSMRPGGPTTAGMVNGRIVFLLPGFPVATMIAFEKFVGPVMRRMMGAKIPDPRTEVTATLTSRVPSALGRLDILRVSLRMNKEGVNLATPVRVSGSGIISSMTKADGEVEIPEDVEGFESGSKVIVKLFHG